jgi:hypothetical protein
LPEQDLQLGGVVQEIDGFDICFSDIKAGALTEVIDEQAVIFRFDQVDFFMGDRFDAFMAMRFI